MNPRRNGRAGFPPPSAYSRGVGGRGVQGMLGAAGTGTVNRAGQHHGHPRYTGVGGGGGGAGQHLRGYPSYPMGNHGPGMQMRRQSDLHAALPSFQPVAPVYVPAAPSRKALNERLGAPEYHVAERVTDEDRFDDVTIRNGLTMTKFFEGATGEYDSYIARRRKLYNIDMLTRKLSQRRAEIERLKVQRRKQLMDEQRKGRIRRDPYPKQLRGIKTKDEWFSKLSNANQPLALLADAFPHGFRSTTLLARDLLTQQVPVLRATWLTRIVHLNDDRSVSSGSSGAGSGRNSSSAGAGDARSAVWTDQITTHLTHMLNEVERVLGDAASEGARSVAGGDAGEPGDSKGTLQPGFLPTWNYFLDLIHWQYSEGLVHRPRFLIWLVEFLNDRSRRVISTATLAFFLSLALPYLDDVSLSLLTVKRWVYGCLLRLSRFPSAQSTYRLRAYTLLCASLRYTASAAPDCWACLGALPPLPPSVLADIRPGANTDALSPFLAAASYHSSELITSPGLALMTSPDAAAGSMQGAAAAAVSVLRASVIPTAASLHRIDTRSVQARAALLQQLVTPHAAAGHQFVARLDALLRQDQPGFGDFGAAYRAVFGIPSAASASTQSDASDAAAGVAGVAGTGVAGVSASVGAAAPSRPAAGEAGVSHILHWAIVDAHQIDGPDLRPLAAATLLRAFACTAPRQRPALQTCLTQFLQQLQLQSVSQVERLCALFSLLIRGRVFSYPIFLAELIAHGTIRTVRHPGGGDGIVTTTTPPDLHDPSQHLRWLLYNMPVPSASRDNVNQRRVALFGVLASADDKHIRAAAANAVAASLSRLGHLPFLPETSDPVDPAADPVALLLELPPFHRHVIADSVYTRVVAMAGEMLPTGAQLYAIVAILDQCQAHYLLTSLLLHLLQRMRQARKIRALTRSDMHHYLLSILSRLVPMFAASHQLTRLLTELFLLDSSPTPHALAMAGTRGLASLRSLVAEIIRRHRSLPYVVEWVDAHRDETLLIQIAQEIANARLDDASKLAPLGKSNKHNFVEKEANQAIMHCLSQEHPSLVPGADDVLTAMATNPTGLRGYLRMIATTAVHSAVAQRGDLLARCAGFFVHSTSAIDVAPLRWDHAFLMCLRDVWLDSIDRRPDRFVWDETDHQQFPSIIASLSQETRASLAAPKSPGTPTPQAIGLFAFVALLVARGALSLRRVVCAVLLPVLDPQGARSNDRLRPLALRLLRMLFDTAATADAAPSPDAGVLRRLLSPTDYAMLRVRVQRQMTAELILRALQVVCQIVPLPTPAVEGVRDAAPEQGVELPPVVQAVLLARGSLLLSDSCALGLTARLRTVVSPAWVPLLLRCLLSHDHALAPLLDPNAVLADLFAAILTGLNDWNLGRAVLVLSVRFAPAPSAPQQQPDTAAAAEFAQQAFAAVQRNGTLAYAQLVSRFLALLDQSFVSVFVAEALTRCPRLPAAAAAAAAKQGDVHNTDGGDEGSGGGGGGDGGGGDAVLTMQQQLDPLAPAPADAEAQFLQQHPPFEDAPASAVQPPQLSVSLYVALVAPCLGACSDSDAAIFVDAMSNELRQLIAASAAVVADAEAQDGLLPGVLTQRIEPIHRHVHLCGMLLVPLLPRAPRQLRAVLLDVLRAPGLQTQETSIDAWSTIYDVLNILVNGYDDVVVADHGKASDAALKERQAAFCDRSSRLLVSLTKFPPRLRKRIQFVASVLDESRYQIAAGSQRNAPPPDVWTLLECYPTRHDPISCFDAVHVAREALRYSDTSSA